ncbi:MAG: hypothetical protein ABIR24_09480 [Verrucomicrobiota bacterium]
MINQFATPGLGSLIARRFVAGSGQLFLALVGFFLFIGWWIQKMRVFYGQMFGTDLPADAGTQLGKWGITIFTLAWVWSLVTSIQIMRTLPKDFIPHLPPKISEKQL